MQMTTLVGGADHKHTHVMGQGPINRGTVVLANEVPMQVDEIELIGGDGRFDQRQGAMGRKAHMANAAFCLPTANHLQASARAEGLVEVLLEVDAVNRQQIQPPSPRQAQALKTGLQFGLKHPRVGIGRHLGLHDPLRIAHLLQQRAQLALGGAVVTGGFDVVKTSCHRFLQGGPQVGLTLRRDRIGREITPALLKAHPAQRQHRHGQARAAKTAGWHPHAHGRGRVRLSLAGWGNPRGWMTCWANWDASSGKAP